MTPDRGLRPAVHTLFALLVLSQLGVVVFQWWEPAFDGSVRYDDIAPLGGAYWPMNVLLGGPAYALGAVATAIFLVALGRNLVTLAGSVIHLLAGLVFALVITAEVLPFAWAADPSITGEAQGRALFAVWNDHFDAFLPYILGSMAAVALGAVVAVAGAAHDGGLRWWVLFAVLLLVVLLFVVPLGSPLVVVVDLAQRALLIYIGWRGRQALLGRV